MNGHKTFSEAPATPEQILGIFRDWQRLEFGKVADEKAILSFNTTVSDWRAVSDLHGWRQLGEALNKFFNTTFSKEEWRAAMKPERQRTLWDVCALVASRANLPKIHEAKILGRACKTASAFFALRSHLRLAGLNVELICPSAKLDSCLRLHTQVAIEVICKLVPGRMPLMKTKFNLGHRLSGWVCFAALVELVAGGIGEKPEWTVIGSVVFCLAFIAITVFSNLPPASVRLDSLKTFGDLSRLIASENYNETGLRR